jgi:hypothetical protein
MSISIDRLNKRENYLDYPSKSELNPFSKYNTIIEEEIPKKKKNKSIGKKKENFLSRNYKIKKLNEDFKMMNEGELNNLYYKLKFYYDDILGQNQKQDSDIEYIRGKNYTVEKKIFDYERAKAVESGTEKISGFDEANNIDSIINKINELKEKTEDTKFNVKNEEEYSSTLKYLMEDSKCLLMKINEDILNTEQKIHYIKLIRKNLNENITNRNNENIESNKMNNILEEQIDKIQEVLNDQKDKKISIEKTNKIKEEKLEQLKERFEDNQKINKIKFKKHKEEVLDKINAYKYRKNEKIDKEKKIVNFIIGFYFFQKYFINKNRENKDKEVDDSIDMTECKKDIEFNNFMKGEQYCLQSESEENEEENIKSDKRIKKIKIKDKKKIHKISFEEIKERFDELDLKYDEFYDFFTKIISKANFSRKKMTSLNERLITLETLKNKYTQKVDDIILKDYKNLYDIINNAKKYDEIRKEQIIRFQRFIENNENNLKNAEKIRNIKASQRITDIHLENIINPDLNIIKKQNAFINKCNDACAKIKFYFENINIGIKHLNNLKDYDTDHQIQNTYKKIMNYTVNFTEKNKDIKKEEYIENLLKYSKEKKIPYAEFIYNILFNSQRKIENMKQFLKDKLTEDNFMFYFFRNYNDINLTNILLNKIIKYYHGKTISSNIGKFSIAGQLFNKIPIKKNGSNLSNQSEYSSIVNLKKKSNISVLINSNDSVNNKKKKQTIEDIINNEYNYEKATDDIDGYNYHKVIRPKTTKLTTNKRIVQHLYEPSLEKTKYLRDLYHGLNNIKISNSKRKLNNRYIIKTWNNIDNLGNQFYIYNNKSKICLFYFFRY